MAWETLTLKQLKSRIIFLTVITLVGTAQLAYAVDINPMDAAERVERMGIIGIQTFMLIMSAAGNLYLLRLLGTKIMSIVEKNSETNERTAIAIESVTTAIEHCKTLKR